MLTLHVICLIPLKISRINRYLDRHSYQHFVETQHTYALELETQRVWDYVGDKYVGVVRQTIKKLWTTE